MRLRHLDADWAATDDNQMFRSHAVGENRFVRQIRYGIEPRDLGDRRPRAGRYDKAAWPDLDLAGADCAAARKSRLTPQHPDPEPLEALDGIIGRNRRDDLLDTVCSRGEFDGGTAGRDAQRCAAPRQMG